MKRKTLAIAGASGMIGAYLAEYLKNYEIQKINRYDFGLENEEFSQKYGNAEVIINLSGAPVLGRWTKRYKKEILASRIKTTRKLGHLVQHDQTRKKMYISASAVGIYDEKDEHTEESKKFGDGFLSEVVRTWEHEVNQLRSGSIRICIMRSGVVFSSSGGMLAKLIPVFRLGLGARIGKGNQYMSWIHIEDLARAVEFIIEGERDGVYNLTAPGYCTNREFTAGLAGSLNKHARLAIPELVLKILYGSGAEVVTRGQAAVPQRLIDEGFIFKYPDLQGALEDIVN